MSESLDRVKILREAQAVADRYRRAGSAWRSFVSDLSLLDRLDDMYGDGNLAVEPDVAFALMLDKRRDIDAIGGEYGWQAIQDASYDLVNELGLYVSDADEEISLAFVAAWRDYLVAYQAGETTLDRDTWITQNRPNLSD